MLYRGFGAAWAGGSGQGNLAMAKEIFLEGRNSGKGRNFRTEGNQKHLEVVNDGLVAMRERRHLVYFCNEITSALGNTLFPSKRTQRAKHCLREGGPAACAPCPPPCGGGVPGGGRGGPMLLAAGRRPAGLCSTQGSVPAALQLQVRLGADLLPPDAVVRPRALRVSQGWGWGGDGAWLQPLNAPELRATAASMRLLGLPSLGVFSESSLRVRCHQMDDFSPAKNLMTMCFTYYYVGKRRLHPRALLALETSGEVCPVHGKGDGQPKLTLADSDTEQKRASMAQKPCKPAGDPHWGDTSC